MDKCREKCVEQSISTCVFACIYIRICMLKYMYVCVFCDILATLTESLEGEGRGRS